MKLFTAFFSFFCLSLLHSAEAKADSYSNHAVRHFEITSQTLTKSCNQSHESKNWTPWPCIFAEEFEFLRFEASSSEPLRSFHAISAKDFFIHTGLSPPILFA
jgi:hypothetical protein